MLCRNSSVRSLLAVAGLAVAAHAAAPTALGQEALAIPTDATVAATPSSELLNQAADLLAVGQIVQLPGWNYPVVADTATGELHFDNYGGAWGKQSELDKLLQTYATEKAKAEARRAGHMVTEQTLADGSIKLTVQLGAMGGGA